ncbi:MAG: hypothetical protein OEV06_00650 [Anaerolineae bacterium]|nr:hypothetical protein [Anaerolineae bacterium]
MKSKYATPTTGLLSLILGIAIGVSFFPTSAIPSRTALNPTPTYSAYASLLDTEIRGLDQATIEGYLAGEGLSQDLPAELNGYPGLRHTLDLTEELELTDEQLIQVQALFDGMQVKAMSLGEQYLQAYSELELAFREGSITVEYLKSQLETIAAIEVELRFVHLSSHLATVQILTHDQIAQYNLLRGYADGMNHEDMDHSK